MKNFNLLKPKNLKIKFLYTIFIFLNSLYSFYKNFLHIIIFKIVQLVKTK